MFDASLIGRFYIKMLTVSLKTITQQLILPIPYYFKDKEPIHFPKEAKLIFATQSPLISCRLTFPSDLKFEYLINDTHLLKQIQPMAQILMTPNLSQDFIIPSANFYQNQNLIDYYQYRNREKKTKMVSKNSFSLYQFLQLVFNMHKQEPLKRNLFFKQSQKLNWISNRMLKHQQVQNTTYKFQASLFQLAKVNQPNQKSKCYFYDQSKPLPTLNRSSGNVQISLSQAKYNIHSQMTREKCNKSVPSFRQIKLWFQKLPKQKKEHLKTNNYYWSKDKQHQKGAIYDRCHILGLQIAKELFIRAASITDWRPTKQVVKDLLKNVVNYQGNFVINTHKKNIQWWKKQRALLIILSGEYPYDIEQAQGVGHLINTIRKRYYHQFFERCENFGMSKTAVIAIKKQLSDIFYQIWAHRYRLKYY